MLTWAASWFAAPGAIRGRFGSGETLRRFKRTTGAHRRHESGRAVLSTFSRRFNLQVLSAILAIAVGIVTGLEWRWFMYLWAPLVIVLSPPASEYRRSGCSATSCAIAGVTLITLEEAATLAGTTEYEVRKRCAVVNRDFDAMAYSDAMYSDKELVDRADALKLKGEIDLRRRQWTAGACGA